MKTNLLISILALITAASSPGLALDFNSMIEEGVSAEKTLRDTLKGHLAPEELDEAEPGPKHVRVSEEVKEVDVTAGEIFAHDSHESVDYKKTDALKLIDEEMIGLSEL